MIDIPSRNDKAQISLLFHAQKHLGFSSCQGFRKVSFKAWTRLWLYFLHASFQGDPRRMDLVPDSFPEPSVVKVRPSSLQLCEHSFVENPRTGAKCALQNIEKTRTQMPRRALPFSCLVVIKNALQQFYVQHCGRV